MNGIYMIIGGNIGDRVKNLQICLSAIGRQIGKATQISALYETAAWGLTEQPAFLNRVIYLETRFDAHTVLEKCLEIERSMGRIRDKKWSSRIIDIDLLFVNSELINEKQLKIPHPHIAERRFVLVPLDEIAPVFVHPVYDKTIHKLLAECKDSLEVKKVSE